MNIPTSSVPSGFTRTGTSRSLTLTVEPAKYKEPLDKTGLGSLYSGLTKWATDNGYKVEPLDATAVGYGGWAELYAWTSFKATASDDPAKHNDRLFKTHDCAYCGNAKIEPGVLFCTACEQFQVCSTCRTAGTQLFKGLGKQGGAHCAKCCAVCTKAGCTEVVPPNSGSDRCVKCEPRETCGGCKHIKPTAELKQVESSVNMKKAAGRGKPTTTKVSLCAACQKFLCSECNIFRGPKLPKEVKHPETEKLVKVCTVCADELYTKYAAKFEAWEKDEMPTQGNLMIPATEDRPVRTVSVEIEFDGNGGQVAKSLFKAGLIPNPQVGGRHREQGDNGSRHPCLLKHDGSVTGGELVAFLLNLDDPKHAAALQRTTEVMRGMEKTGHAQFTTRAGGHIHTDLHGFGLRDCWNTYTLFKYLESTLYHLAGAGFDEGHRSLSGNNYTPPPTPGPFGTLEKFASALKPARNNNARLSFNDPGTGGLTDRTGLHFTNYTYALDNCGCGVIATGRWENCTCDLGKATAEWRLWNASITPRILHAWLSLALSITAYAQENEDMAETEFPYFNWPRSATIGAADKKKHMERLEWIHRELPLTTHERNSIVYAAKKSHLKALGEDYLDSLLQITSNAEKARKEKKKPPKRPSAQRKTNLEVKAVGNADTQVLEAVAAGFSEGGDDDDICDGCGEYFDSCRC